MWANLLGTIVHVGPRMHTIPKIEGVMLAPVATENVGKALAECLILPALDGTACIPQSQLSSPRIQ
jgi:hypothetical protein